MSHAQRILIVDDEPNVRLVFRTALESTGAELAAAEDGEAALAWLEANRVDLVLLDLQMPGLGGMERPRPAPGRGHRRAGGHRHRHGSIPDAVAAMKLGAIDFLAKPLTPDALRRAVAEVLDRAGPGRAGPTRGRPAATRRAVRRPTSATPSRRSTAATSTRPRSTSARPSASTPARPRPTT